jgi:hypothetical protein
MKELLKVPTTLKQANSLPSLQFDLSSANTIGSSSSKQYRVCERAFLYIVGLLRESSAKLPDAWTNAKKEVEDPHSVEIKKMINQTRAPHYNVKANIKSFLKYLGDKFSDYSITAGQEKVKILPYETIAQVYKAYTEWEGVEEEERVCSISYFKETLREEAKMYRLMRCRGSFPTCDICNNADDMISDRRLTPAMHDIAFLYKKLHLRQQERERAAMREAKMRSRTEMDQKGNPLECHFLIDAMTAEAVNTPAIGHKKVGKNDKDKHILSRVIGSQVTCGNISGTFLYLADQSMRGGTNLFITVVRESISDLASLLHKDGKKLPEVLNLNFDNCTDNKVHSFGLSLFHADLTYRFPPFNPDNR